MIDHIIGAYQSERRLVVKACSLAAHFLLRFGKQRDRFAPTRAAFLAAAYTPLCGFERPFGFAIPARREDALAIR
jgi:hypothetical protein